MPEKLNTTNASGLTIGVKHPNDSSNRNHRSDLFSKLIQLKRIISFVNSAEYVDNTKGCFSKAKG